MDGVDIVVSFGGGSCADLGKAVCFFTEQEAGNAGHHVRRPAGAAPRVDPDHVLRRRTHAVLRDDRRSQQAQDRAPAVRRSRRSRRSTTPSSRSTRRWTSRPQTGMNALAHGVECAYSPARTPEAEADRAGLHSPRGGRAATRRRRSRHLGARTAMLEGAVLGGRCLQNASDGCAPRAVAAARWPDWHPARAGQRDRADPRAAVQRRRRSRRSRSHRAALGDELDPPGAVDRLRERLGLPGRLSDCGVDDDDLDAVVRQIGGNHNIKMNPKPVTEDDARAILEAAF